MFVNLPFNILNFPNTLQMEEKLNRIIKLNTSHKAQ